MAENNHLSRLLALLGLTFAFCCFLYYLPDEVAGYSLKRVDLFADLREPDEALSLDSLAKSWLAEDTLAVDTSALQRQAVEKAGIDSASLALRDSLYRTLYAVEGADSLGIRSEH